MGLKALERLISKLVNHCVSDCFLTVMDWLKNNLTRNCFISGSATPSAYSEISVKKVTIKARNVHSTYKMYLHTDRAQ